MKPHDILDLASLYLMNTYGKREVVVARGAGTRVWDDKGNEYLDFLSGIAVSNLGHCHPAVVRAIRRQCQQLIHCSNLYLNEPQVNLARELCKRSFAEKVFFCNSGTEAAEAALKLARLYSKRKYSPDGEAGENERFTIVAMHNSFHGRTLGALSATGQEKYRKGFEPFVPGFRFAAFNNLRSVHECMDESCCAVIVEPIQGEGGVVPATKGFMQGLRAVCDERALMLILDEVQCGLGRTGTLFAYEQYEIEPDVLVLAKPLGGGLPLGALLAKGEIAEAFKPTEHASTFGGNPVCAAAALAYLKVLVREKILERTAGIAAFLISGLRGLAEKYKVVGDVRGLGLMLGLEVKATARTIVDACRQKGLLVGTAGEHVVRLLPPLIVTEEECRHALEILDDVLKEITEPE
jgi:acetylornithine/N-succinyldiaminopimelate aminotransferase